MTDMTAADVKAALHDRYAKPSQGRAGERYVCLEEARSGAGFQGNTGQCDFLAINTWRSRGMELIGHEVKVSMSDWRSELADPAKAERFSRFCRRWYVAAPSALASAIKHEVPPAWGLLSVSDNGRCTETVKPTVRQEPEDVPDWWWIGWLAQVDRQHKRRLPQLVQRGMADERERLEERIRERVARDYDYRLEQAETVAANVDAIRDATGINLDRVGRWELDRLAKAWDLAAKVPVLDGLVGNLRRVADALEAAAAEDDEEEADVA